MNATDGPSTISVCLAYRDCPAAIEWLIDVLGFTRHAVIPGDAGDIIHAELRLGGTFLMLGSATKEGRDWLGAPVGPATLAIFAGDNAAVDAVHARVKADGARIVRELCFTSYGEHGGSYGFTCLDAEDNRWSIGTYHPTQHPAG